MKIALINFPILDVGGITTWAEYIKIGYEKVSTQDGSSLAFDADLNGHYQEQGGKNGQRES